MGKTNFLCAIRYLFDREMRKHDLLESDFFKRNTAAPIEIIVAIDKNVETNDIMKLRSRFKGCVSSDDTLLYIKLTADYNEQENHADVDLHNLFKRNINALVKKDEINKEADIETEMGIV